MSRRTIPTKASVSRLPPKQTMICINVSWLPFQFRSSAVIPEVSASGKISHLRRGPSSLRVSGQCKDSRGHAASKITWNVLERMIATLMKKVLDRSPDTEPADVLLFQFLWLCCKLSLCQVHPWPPMGSLAASDSTRAEPRLPNLDSSEDCQGKTCDLRGQDSASPFSSSGFRVKFLMSIYLSLLSLFLPFQFDYVFLSPSLFVSSACMRGPCSQAQAFFGALAFCLP